MRKIRSVVTLVGLSGFVCLALELPAVAQEKGAKNKKEGSAAEAEKQSFEQKFWNWLKKVEYDENLSPWPGTKDEFYPGKSPHGAFLKTYVNRPVAKNPEDPGMKSVIVKENYSEEKELKSLTIMYRAKKGYDPAHNDWYWVKYLPDGKVAKKDGTQLAGKVKACIDCHASAAGDDYIFTNDE